jgi:hypothetical protein
MTHEQLCQIAESVQEDVANGLYANRMSENWSKHHCFCDPEVGWYCTYCGIHRGLRRALDFCKLILVEDIEDVEKESSNGCEYSDQQRGMWVADEVWRGLLGLPGGETP